jgi:hypothetical protein
LSNHNCERKRCFGLCGFLLSAIANSPNDLHAEQAWRNNATRGAESARSEGGRKSCSATAAWRAICLRVSAAFQAVVLCILRRNSAE